MSLAVWPQTDLSQFISRAPRKNQNHVTFGTVRQVLMRMCNCLNISSPANVKTTNLVDTSSQERNDEVSSSWRKPLKPLLIYLLN